jgi:hypothetical protein
MAIASCLVDTNILPRMTRRFDPQHQVVDAALARLAGQGTILHYTHQNVAELGNAMTRPVVRNGFGLSAESEVRAIEAGMISYQTMKPSIGSGDGLFYGTVCWAFKCTTLGWQRPCTSTRWATFSR